MKIFEFCITYAPRTGKDSDEHKIIVGPKTILASDIDKAKMIASRDIPDYYMNILEQVTLVVRPF